MDNSGEEFPKWGFSSIMTFVFTRARHAQAKTKVMMLGNPHLGNSTLELSILIYSHDCNCTFSMQLVDWTQRSVKRDAQKRRIIVIGLGGGGG